MVSGKDPGSGRRRRWSRLSGLWATGRTRARGGWCGPFGDIDHLGTLLNCSPTKVTEKAHLVHGAWKTMPHLPDFRGLKTSVVNSYHEKERTKLLKVLPTFRKLCMQREGKSQDNFFEMNRQDSLHLACYSYFSPLFSQLIHLENST